MYICPKCHGDKNISTERRIDGNSYCECGYSGKTSTFLTGAVLDIKKPAKVEFMDDIGNVIAEVTAMYHRGEVDGIMFIVKSKKEDAFQHVSCGNLNYLEKIGMLESAKHDVFLDASCPFYNEEEE